MSGDAEEVTAVGGGVTQGGHEAREEGSEEAQQGGVQTKYSICKSTFRFNFLFNYF